MKSWVPSASFWHISAILVLRGTWGHQHKAFSVYIAGNSYLSHPVIDNTVLWLLLGYKGCFSCCAKSNSTIFLPAFLFLCAKTVTRVCYVSFKARVINNSEHSLWTRCIFSHLVCHCTGRVYSADARSGQKLLAAGGNLLLVNGVSLNTGWVPGTHMKLSMTQAWKVCRWRGETLCAVSSNRWK